MKQTFKLGELFCGPGGMSLGAKMAKHRSPEGSFKIEHGWASDYHADSCRTFEQNISKNKGLVVHHDVRELDITQLPPIDAFAYGFPCNDFSLVGEHKGEDGQFGGLYRYGLDVLDHFNPRFFVAENVGGITSANGGRALEKILYDLSESGRSGYELTVHKYRAEEYGVPQSRQRVIIVGINQAENLTFKVPRPTHRDPITARAALEDTPIAEGAANHEFTRQHARVIKRLEHTKPGENAWNADLPEEVRLNVKGARLSNIYRRLHPDKPSYTVTGSGGGGTHMYHWEEPRALTNRERARLQSFPDKFVFSGSKDSVRRQIGMAVPPRLAQVIFTAILKTFAGVNYRSVPANMEFGNDLFSGKV